jgi:hypothetical protein
MNNKEYNTLTSTGDKVEIEEKTPKETEVKQTLQTSIREVARKRREEIGYSWIERGPRAIPMRAWAEKYHCSLEAIRLDYEYLAKQIKIEDIERLGKKIILGMIATISRAEKSAAMDPDNTRKNLACAELYDRFQKQLESWGYKEQIAQKLSLELSKVENINVTFDLPEEFKALKRLDNVVIDISTEEVKK